jgi:hypothetical protein
MYPSHLQNPPPQQRPPGDFMSAVMGATSILSMSFSALHLLHFIKELALLSRSILLFLAKKSTSMVRFVGSFAVTRWIGVSLHQLAQHKFVRPSLRSCLMNKILFLLRMLAAGAALLIAYCKNKVDVTLDHHIQVIDGST